MEPKTLVTRVLEKDGLRLFEGYGIELEYMIVDKETLNVLPICDKLMKALSGSITSEVVCGEISYSNELALHVVELKTTNPMSTLDGLDKLFQEHIWQINAALQPLGAQLLPTAMHPWMDPHKEMQLWEHEYNPIYEAYHRIFNCRGHGWANLQSTHINLPFHDDHEFSRLHAAIRLLLPIMPALAASSPIFEAKETGYLDNRLVVYQENQKCLPTITGKVVPESVHSYRGYQQLILEPMYREIASLDPEGILQFEWLNSRGAIARFDRMAIEIRVLDIQECPQADIAIARAITKTLQYLIDQKRKEFPLEPLASLFVDCAKNGEATHIANLDYLRLFGASQPMTAGELWRHILKDSSSDPSLDVILNQGTLASRILRAYHKNPTSENLHQIYRQLMECLIHGKMFSA